LHRGVLLGQLGVEVHSIAQRRGAYLNARRRKRTSSSAIFSWCQPLLERHGDPAAAAGSSAFLGSAAFASRSRHAAQANADIAATIVKARIAAIFDIACITAIFASASARANAGIAATIAKARIAAIFDIACITAIFASASATTVAAATPTSHFDAGRYSAC